MNSSVSLYSSMSCVFVFCKCLGGQCAYCFPSSVSVLLPGLSLCCPRVSGNEAACPPFLNVFSSPLINNSLGGVLLAGVFPRLPPLLPLSLLIPLLKLLLPGLLCPPLVLFGQCFYFSLLPPPSVLLPLLISLTLLPPLPLLFHCGQCFDSPSTSFSSPSSANLSASFSSSSSSYSLWPVFLLSFHLLFFLFFFLF